MDANTLKRQIIEAEAAVRIAEKASLYSQHTADEARQHLLNLKRQLSQVTSENVMETRTLLKG